MKRFALFAFAALLAAGAWAHQYETTVDGVAWYYNRISDGKGGYDAEITYRGSSGSSYSNEYSGSLTIPSTLGGYKVTSIGSYAFSGCSSLTSVTIPNSVKSIEEHAFLGCSSLTSAIIGNGVTEIGEWAFYNCSSLTSVTIPDSVTTIGDYAFCNCSSLISVTIPDGVTKIGGYAFHDCSSLTSITIPDGVTTIGPWAFCKCSSLTSVTILNSVISIGPDTFCDCSSLTEIIGWRPGCPTNVERIVISDSVTTIGSGTFRYCSSLTSVTIPDSVTTIGSSAFDGCSSLTSVTIPGRFRVSEIFPDAYSKISTIKIADGSTSICDGAFLGCSSLTSVTIPDSVTEIGASAFSRCSSLKEVHITDLAKWCAISFASSYANPFCYAHHLYLNGEEVKDLVIPDSVTAIGSSAFSGCSSLTSVTISDSVTTIEERAFLGCSSLTSVTIPDSVTTIGPYAFYNCRSLTSVTIGNGVATIGSYAFDGCSSLKEIVGWRPGCPTNIERIVVSNNVTTIEERAFSGCSSLTSVTIPDSVTTIGPYAFYNCRSLTSVTIGNGVATIGSYAFDGCSSLTSVTIPNSVKSIEEDAFSGCSSLTSVTIPDSVTMIGASAFSRCSSLASVTIPDSVTTIGSDAFYGCGLLTSVTIPDSVTTIGARAFKDCKSLTSIMISVNVTTIGDEAFYGCSSLTSVTIPDSVTTIGEWAFGHCHLLESITIPNSVTTIKSSAFRCCYSRKKIVIAEDNQEYSSKNGLLCSKDGKTILLGINGNVTIPAGVKTIEAFAFSDCSSLTSVTIPDSVTTIGSYAFGYCSSLREVHITDLAKWCAISFGEATANPCYYAHHLFLNGEEIKDLAIPDSVTTIGSYAFYSCSSLTSVTIPNSVTSIGSDTFYNCSSLKEIIGWRPGCPTNVERIVISDRVTTIGSGTFRYCSSLTSVTIPNSVKSIEEDAFYNCSSLTSVTIPDSVTTIERGAFGGCSSLREVHITDLAKWCAISFGDATANPCYYAHHLFLNGEEIKDLVVPDGVTTIRERAFCGCSSLTSITIPSRVTSIGSSAFSGCSSLTSVTIPGSYKLSSVFPDAYLKISSLIVASGVTSIGSYAFRGCSSLTSVTIPDSVTEIGASAFSRCSSLTSVTIPESVTTIGSSAFSGCSSLTSVTIPESVTTIGEDAFAGCDKLTNVIIEPSSTLTFDSSWGIVENKIVWQCDVKVIVSNREQSYTYNCQKYQGGYKLACNCNNFDLNNIKYIGAPLPELQNVGTAKIPVENTDFEYIGGDIRFRNVVVECLDHELSITILPRTVSVTSAGASKIYDGKPLTATFSIEGDGFVDGECSVSVSGSQTLVGSCKNAITLDWSEGASASNYDITFTEGDLVVLPRSVSVTSASASKIYDGKPLRATFSIEGDGFVDGECSVSVSGSQTSVGSCKNTLVLDWAEGASAGNYNLTLTEGTLTVLPAKVPEIAKGSFETSFTYDGEEHTIDIAGVESIKLIDAPRFAYALSETGPWSHEVPTFKDAGVHSVWYKISADNYEDYIQEAKVTILPRKVTLVSEDAEKFYDGDPLTNEAAKVAIGEFVAGDTYSLHFTGAQLDEGESENAFSVVWDGTAKASNYEVTKQYGMLKVTRLYGEISGDGVANSFPYSYAAMTNVTIATNIKTIDKSFFEGCTSLKTVKFPYSLCEIDCHAFDTCPNIKWEIRDGYKFMDGWLFGYTDDAEEEIPDGDSIRGIADGALDGCMAIRRFKCSDKALLKRIPPKAFADCGNLKEVELPEGLEEIGEEAFIGCSEVANFVIPGSVKPIGDRAFAYCSSLTNAQIAYGVESIGDEAFLDCWRISEVDIPSTVKSVGANAFGGDSSIIRAGMRGDIRKISEVFSNYMYIREFIIKEGEGALKDRLFAGCSELKDVRILGDCPELEDNGQNLYAEAGTATNQLTGLRIDLSTYVTKGSYGWNGRKNSTALPQAWPLTGSYRHSIAIWDNPTYLCEFDSNGGTLGVQKTYQTSEKNFILPPEPTQSGYVFGGWWTSPVGGIHITEKNIFIEGVYQRLYAHWVKARTVILDANGGTITTNAMMYVEQTTYGVLPAPVRTGYAFGGWTYNGQTIVPDTSIKTDADHQLLAQWNAIKYTVKFNANYGTGSAADMLCAYDKPYSTPTEGFSNGSEKLSGWALSPQGEVVYKRGESFKNLASQEGKIVILYAIYRKGSSAELQDLYDEYGPFVPGKEIEPIDFSFAVGWKITGLPTGLKFDTKTSKIIGKPTKSGEFKVTLTRTSDKTVATTTFVVMSAEKDKAAIEIKVGEDMRPEPESDEFAALTLPVGVFVNWPIEATALSATTVKVAGLPSGLKLVQDKVTKAYSIQGTPTAASKVDKKTGNIVPSLAKFTVTTAGKNSRVFTMPITTEAMPAWAVGTFNGGLISAEGKELGLVTLTTTAAGKISGKILKRGQTWAVSATGFDAYDADGYHATLTAKSGKLTPETYEIVISKEGVFGANADGEQIEAYWNPWKTPQGKARGKDLAAMYKPGLPTEGLELPEGMTSLTLKLSASGAINATGFFDGGYKATSSTVLVSTDSGYLVYLYFAPNAKKGFVAGEAFTVRLDL